MGVIIKPIKDKKTKKPISNVDMCKRMYAELHALETGDPNDSEAVKTEKKVALDKITGGNTTEVMSWLKQVAETQDERLAQQLIQSTLLPVAFKQ